MKKLYPKIFPKKVLASFLVWNFRSHFWGGGQEFHHYREYSYGDNAKRIDWQVSTRSTKTLMRTYHEETSINILCVCDISETLSYEDHLKKHLMKKILRHIADIAESLWENLWAYILSSGENTFIQPRKPHKNLPFFYKEIDEKMKHISSCDSRDYRSMLSCKMKKSLLFFLSDTLDIDSKSLSLLSQKHDIIYIHLSSQFEDTLEWEGICHLSLWEKEIFIDTADIRKREQYRLARLQEKKSLKSALEKIGVQTLFLTELSDIYLSFVKLLEERKKLM